MELIVALGITYFISHYVIMPMFNTYLEYKMQMKSFDNPPIEVHGPIEGYEERSQRDTDESDSPIEIGESDERTPIHDERVSL